MQEKMKEIFQTIHGKNAHTYEESWTLAPQKSLVEMLNGVWKPPKVFSGLLKPFSSTSNKLICQMT